MTLTPITITLLVSISISITFISHDILSINSPWLQIDLVRGIGCRRDSVCLKNKPSTSGEKANQCVIPHCNWIDIRLVAEATVILGFERIRRLC